MATAAPAGSPGTNTASPDPKRWLALLVIGIAQLMIVLDSSIVNIALPSAEKALHISAASQQWVVTAYTLTFGGLLLLGGRVADYLGRRKVLIAGLIGFALASALGGFAQAAWMLFASRAAQGVFAALMSPAALSLISVTFTEPHERSKAFGVWGAIAGGGAAIGLVAGGLLTEFASWRWCLLVNLPIAIIAAVGAVAFVRESSVPSHGRYDVTGGVLATGGLVSLVYGFTLASQHSWGSTSTLVAIGVGLVLLAAFVVVEARSSSPLLPLRILAHRTRGGALLGSFFVGVGMLGMFLFLTLYFQQVLGFSPLRSGFAFLPFSVGVILAAGASSKLIVRTGPRPLLVIGFAMAAAGLANLTRIGAGSDYLSIVLPSCLLISVGMGLGFVAMSECALTGIDDHDAGVASATLNATNAVGGSLGTALMNTVATTAATTYITAHMASAMAKANPQTKAAGLAVAHAVKAQGAVHGYRLGFGLAAVALASASVASGLLVGKLQPSEMEPRPVHV